MGDLGLDLEFKCRVDNDGDGDRFVGIKADSSGTLVYFPMGYQLPKGDQELQHEVLKLISILQIFMNKQDRVLHMQKNEAPQYVDFPINAYMNIIRSYLSTHSYYTEKEWIRKNGDHGKIDWSATLKRNVAFYEEDGTPFLNHYTIKALSPNETEWITKIHQYCVYESFKRLGCFFTNEMPKDPHIQYNKHMFITILNTKLAKTFNTDDKILFQSMIAMLEFLDEETEDRQYYFGTDRFEYVWENLIDEVFGIKNKQDYFPHTDWNLLYAENRQNSALEPDTIMIYDGKIYVLDAKYYRYGVTGEPKHLPNSASINKQITYAEYIQNNKELKKRHGDSFPIYNAFLMPFNRKKNDFGIKKPFGNIGEATSQWKHGHYDYERVQGIVVDVYFLMSRYCGTHETLVQKMAEIIDSAMIENKKQFSKGQESPES